MQLDQSLRPRGDPRDFHGVFAGLGPCSDKDRFLGEIARNSSVEPFCQPDIGFIGQNLMAGMGELGHLVGDRRHHLGVAMARIHHRDSRRKVDIAVAFDIPDLGIQGAIGIDLCHHPHPARDGIITAAGHFCVQHGVLLFALNGHAESSLRAFCGI